MASCSLYNITLFFKTVIMWNDQCLGYGSLRSPIFAPINLSVTCEFSWKWMGINRYVWKSETNNLWLLGSCRQVKLHGSSNKIRCLAVFGHTVDSKTVTTHPWSTPQAIPLSNHERIPSTACWDRLRGVFQRCVETTLDWWFRTPVNSPFEVGSFYPWLSHHLRQVFYIPGGCLGIFSINSIFLGFTTEELG